MALRETHRKRIRVLRQSAASECGLVCLAMIASFYGGDKDLSILRRRFNVSLKGVRLSALMQWAEEIGLAARPLRVEPEHFAEMVLPCILHWDFRHFVVLESAANGIFTIVDPAGGRRTLTLPELSRHFTGVALEVTPSASFVRGTERSTIRLRDLFRGTPDLRRLLAELALLALALEVFVLLGPLMLQITIDGVLPSADTSLLLQITVAFALGVCVQYTVGWFRSWLVIYASARLNHVMLNRVMAHVLSLPPMFFERRQTGDILSRFESVNQIQAMLTSSFIEALIDGVMVCVTLTMMLLYAPQLAAVSVIAATIYLGFRLILRPRLLDAVRNVSMTVRHICSRV